MQSHALAASVAFDTRGKDIVHVTNALSQIGYSVTAQSTVSIVPESPLDNFTNAPQKLMAGLATLRQRELTKLLQSADEATPLTTHAAIPQIPDTLNDSTLADRLSQLSILKSDLTNDSENERKNYIGRYMVTPEGIKIVKKTLEEQKAAFSTRLADWKAASNQITASHFFGTSSYYSTLYPSTHAHPSTPGGRWSQSSKHTPHISDINAAATFYSNRDGIFVTQNTPENIQEAQTQAWQKILEKTIKSAIIDADVKRTFSNLTFSHLDILYTNGSNTIQSATFVLNEGANIYRIEAQLQIDTDGAIVVDIPNVGIFATKETKIKAELFPKLFSSTYLFPALKSYYEECSQGNISTREAEFATRAQEVLGLQAADESAVTKKLQEIDISQRKIDVEIQELDTKFPQNELYEPVLTKSEKMQEFYTRVAKMIQTIEPPYDTRHAFLRSVDESTIYQTLATFLKTQGLSGDEHTQYVRDWNDYQKQGGIQILISQCTRYDTTVSDRIRSLVRVFNQLATCSKPANANPFSINAGGAGDY
jgi:hypothetical protein